MLYFLFQNRANTISFTRNFGIHIPRQITMSKIYFVVSEKSECHSRNDFESYLCCIDLIHVLDRNVYVGPYKRTKIDLRRMNWTETIVISRPYSMFVHVHAMTVV